MKVFLGFGYKDNDKWIPDLVIPFIQSLNCTVLTGEEMQGEDLAQGVIDRITEADVCIGLLTKRDKLENETYSTHHWVIAELANALALGKMIFEIREKGVEKQKGQNANRQRYEFEDKSFLLLEISKFINKEKAKLTSKTFMLLPDDFSDEIRPVRKYAKCTYRFWHQGKEYKEEEAELKLMSSGKLAIIVKKIPGEDANIDITIEAPNKIIWNSGYEPVGINKITLQKE